MLRTLLEFFFGQGSLLRFKKKHRTVKRADTPALGEDNLPTTITELRQIVEDETAPIGRRHSALWMWNNESAIGFITAANWEGRFEALADSHGSHPARQVWATELLRSARNSGEKEQVISVVPSIVEVET